MRVRVVLVLLPLLAWSPAAKAAGGCDPWLHKVLHATGDYLTVSEGYARGFVFAMGVDCNGKRERITVQRPTGRLPICGDGHQVEVVGRLIWNKALVDGHYEINDPKSVTCH